MKYRKKPVVVEAFKFDGDFKTRTGEHYVPLWAEAALHEGIICFAGERCQILAIRTSEGVKYIDIGDYVVRGIDGEIYPCKADIFEKTFEEVKTCKKDTLNSVVRNEVDIERVAEELNQKLEKALGEDSIPKFPMRLDDVKLGFNFSCDNKREFKMLWNGHEVENIKNITLNVPTGGVPTMTVEVYLDSLNKDMFEQK